MYEVWEENFLDYVHPLQPNFFDGKLGLDAGCGSRFLKPNATMFAWVYGPRYGISEKISVFLRKFTTKMNYRLLYAFCFSIALFLRTFSHLPYKVMRKVPGLRKVAEKLPIKEHHKYPFRVVVADAFDRLSVPIVNYYTAEQFRKWFDDAGLVDVKIIERFRNNISWRGFGTKI